MGETITQFLSWAAPIASTVIITALTAQINARAKRDEQAANERHEATVAKRKAEDEWRRSVDERMSGQDMKIDMLLSAQCSQIRSDIIHKCHRYLDDLGMASVEEKQSLHAEYEDYQRLCAESSVENHFVDQLVARVMALPERNI